jgi:hypothetical protein
LVVPAVAPELAASASAAGTSGCTVTATFKSVEVGQRQDLNVLATPLSTISLALTAPKTAAVTRSKGATKNGGAVFQVVAVKAWTHKTVKVTATTSGAGPRARCTTSFKVTPKCDGCIAIVGSALPYGRH